MPDQTPAGMPINENPRPTRGIPVTLDRERRLRYTFKTRRQMLEAVGGEEAFQKGLTGDKLPEVLWYGLRHEDPSLTVGDVEDMVDMENLNEVVQCMLKAMGYKGQVVTLPPEAGAEGNPPSVAPAAEGEAAQ